jgi:ethanolamine phosphate transferase 2 subunit G
MREFLHQQNLTSCSMRRRNFKLMSPVNNAGILLGAFRVIRRWNQTGQKHAGAPDISRSYLTTQPSILWLLIALTFFNVAYNLNSEIPAGSRLQFIVPLLALLASAVGFKISFTAADAPELLTNLVRLPLKILDRISLITQAKAVFVGLGWFALAIFVQNRIFLRSGANSYSE